MESLASHWLELMPQKALDIVRGQRLAPGGDLVKLDFEYGRPSSKEISANYVWLRPVVERYPSKVPSQFLLTDAMLKLDEKFNGYLLVCTETETKQDLGGKESRRVKKLLGALRHLFRNSAVSHDHNVTILKGFLQKNPNLQRGKGTDSEDAEEHAEGRDAEEEDRADEDSASEGEGPEDPVDDEDGESDSGSHNESTQPMPDLSDAEALLPSGEPAEEPVPVGENPHVEDPEESRKANLKKFWQKYKVPKFQPDAVPAPCDDDVEMTQDSTPSQDDGDDESEVEHEPSPPEGSTCGLPEDNGSLPSQDDASFNKELFEIDPRWKGEKPWVQKSGGRVYTFVPSERTYDRTLPDGSMLPPTPPLGPTWADTLNGETSSPESREPLADEEGDGEDEESENGERYNPGGKADVMPPCGKFGLEEFCDGPNCQTCQLALEDGDDDVSGAPRAAFALSELFGEPRSGEKRKSPAAESALTLKTPPSKKPDFFGSAVVDTPEKECEDKQREVPKRAGKKKAKNRGSGKKSKASFKVNGGGAGLKVGKTKGYEGDESLTYKGTYDLSKFPDDALPDPSKPNKGAHSYTLISPCGKGSIEVLLRHSAFFVKKVAPTGSGPSGQVSFSRYGGEHGAWQEAKRRAGFPQ